MNWLVWAVLSALFAAATALLAKVGVAHVDPNLATAIRTSVVLVFAWAIALSLGSHSGLAHVGRRSWLFLIASGLATGLSWICYFRALSMGEASKVAPIDKLSVVFVALLAWPLLGETITLAKAAGVLLDRRRGDRSGMGLGRSLTRFAAPASVPIRQLCGRAGGQRERPLYTTPTA